MEQKGPSDGTSNVLRCRQELDATTKKINKLAESKSKHQRHVNSSSSSKNRSNLSHPTIPPPPPPEKHLKSINYTLRQDNIGEMSPRAPPIQQEVSATSNNMAFIKIGQKESQKDIKSISLPIQPHQRHLSNSQYVITSSSSSNVKAPSFGFEGISKADYKHSISKSSSLKDDEGRLANNESSAMLLSGMQNINEGVLINLNPSSVVSNKSNGIKINKGQTRRSDNCSLMNEHRKRKDERGKDAQRKNEQTSMSKQQMSRNKGTRQEDDNKSKECFDAIATGNPSNNNSTPSTSHSKEKASFTFTQHDSTLVTSDSSTASVISKERNRKHSPNDVLDIKDLSQSKKQQNEFIDFESDTNNTNDSLEINSADPKDFNFLATNKTSGENSEYSEYFTKTSDPFEYNSNTIRRKPTQKVSNTAKSFYSNSSSHADSKLLLQTSTSFTKSKTFDKDAHYQECYELNHPSLIAAFHQQASQRKDSQLPLQYGDEYHQNVHGSFETRGHTSQIFQNTYDDEEIFPQNPSTRYSKYHSSRHKHQTNGLGLNSSQTNTEFGRSETKIRKTNANVNNAGSNMMENKNGRQFKSKIANLSQGSCDNTPDTPDSLDSLVGSETDGGGAVNRDEDEDPQLSITEPEASSQSLDATSPLSPDRGIFSSLGGAQTTDMTSECLLPVYQSKNTAKCQRECLPDSQSITSPKYTTSPFPSVLEEKESKSISSSVTSLSCPQTAYWNTSTGNLSSCQISQRDNLIEEVSTPVPTSQQKYLLEESEMCLSQSQSPSPLKMDGFRNLNMEMVQTFSRDAILPATKDNRAKPDLLVDPLFGQPLLSSSCSPTLGDSQQSTPTAARASTSPATSETPPLRSSHSRGEYAFENSSITNTNVELSNVTESEKLSYATPFSSNKSSICSTSPSSNFTSTLCAQSSSTTPICKLPGTTSFSIPSNCSSLVSSQASFKQNDAANSLPNYDQRYVKEQENKSRRTTDFKTTYEDFISQNEPSVFNISQKYTEEYKPSSIQAPSSKMNATDILGKNTLYNLSSPSKTKTDFRERTNDGIRYISEKTHSYQTSPSWPQQCQTRENIVSGPITKQPSKSPGFPSPQAQRNKKDSNVVFKEPMSNISSKSPKQRHRKFVERTKEEKRQFSGSISNRNNGQPSNKNITSTPTCVLGNNNEAMQEFMEQAKPNNNDKTGNQQQNNNYAPNLNMPGVHGNMMAPGGGFIIHPCKNNYDQSEMNPVNNQQQDYYCQPPQPIYMAIIPAQGHPQMMQGANPQQVPQQPNKSPSCTNRNNYGSGPQRPPNVLASPTVISGLPFSGSSHYATLGRLAKDKVTGNMIFITCDAGGNPTRVDQGFIQGRSPVQLRSSSSNPQLQSGGVGNIQKPQMSRSMSHDQNCISKHSSQPGTPKVAQRPYIHPQQHTQIQLSPAALHKQNNERPESISSRYATIGRHNHKTHYNPSQQMPSPQMNQLHQDLKATMGKRTIPKPSCNKINTESPQIKQSQVDKLNARKVNHNLTSPSLTKMSYSTSDTREKFHARESLPLADVRKMATNVILQQPLPLSGAVKPPIHQLPSEQQQRLNIALMSNSPSPRSPHNLGRKIESHVDEKDTPTNESESESDQEDEEDEEDKIRRDASLPTILLPKPKRKPPFTIEGAMNSILKRNNKTEKESKLDNVRFEKDDDEENQDNGVDYNQPKGDTNNDERGFFAFLSNNKNSSNNNKLNDNENIVSNNETKKKRTFGFTKLRVNLKKTSTKDADNLNNNPTIILDNDLSQTKVDNASEFDNALDTSPYYKNNPSDDDGINTSPHHYQHNKFDSMERRRQARLLKSEEDGEKCVNNSSQNGVPHGVAKRPELNGNSISIPIKEQLIEQDQNHISNSSTTSRESLDNRQNKPYPPPDTFNNMISNKFKKSWRKSKKAAPPPPPPNQLVNKENSTQITAPMVHNMLPNGYAGGKDKQGNLVKEGQNPEKISKMPNDIILACNESSIEQLQEDSSRIENIEHQRLDGKTNSEIIGTRSEVLDEELLVDLRDLDQTKVHDNRKPEDREPFPSSPLSEQRRNSKQVSSNSREGMTSDSPMMGRKPRKSSMLTDFDEDEDYYEDDHDEFEDNLEKESEDEPPEDDIHPNEMEICDPCYCYGKCCLDVVASIFCVSLL